MTDKKRIKYTIHVTTRRYDSAGAAYNDIQAVDIAPDATVQELVDKTLTEMSAFEDKPTERASSRRYLTIRAAIDLDETFFI